MCHTRPDNCPCGAAASYTACCGRYLDGGFSPETAEALMRSRYVAYVRGRADYLLQTWHPSTRPASLDLSAETGSWLGLKVLRVEAGGAEEVEGLVEFVARYKVNGRAQRLHEVSRFVREECRWFYREAEGTTWFPSPSSIEPLAIIPPSARQHRSVRRFIVLLLTFPFPATEQARNPPFS